MYSFKVYISVVYSVYIWVDVQCVCIKAFARMPLRPEGHSWRKLSRERALRCARVCVCVYICYILHIQYILYIYIYIEREYICISYTVFTYEHSFASVSHLLIPGYSEAAVWFGRFKEHVLEKHRAYKGEPELCLD